MIKTETKRWIVMDESCVTLPDDVQRALKEWNRTHSIKLDILWDAETSCWQIYIIKLKGAIPKEDTLHWQMSAPSEGTAITPGILDWLKKYDTSNNGYLEQDEIKKRWLETWKKGVEKLNLKKQKEAEDREYGYKDLIFRGIGTARTQVPVGITVGFNKRTGKKIMLVPKKKGLILP